MAVLPDASSATLDALVRANVEPGSTVITDGWRGYDHLTSMGYMHDQRSKRAARVRGEDIGELLPGVHRIGALAKRWILGTHQGSVETSHLGTYLNEFVFRFNRRTSRSTGLAFYRVHELAFDHAPVRYRDLIASQRPPPDPVQTSEHPRTPADPGPPVCGPSVAVRPAPQLPLRLNGYPQR